MTKVIVVEDDAEKLRRVLLCLREVAGIDKNCIDNARDVNAAKRLLRENQYDLLILDISVPEQSDELPSLNGGIDLLREVLERPIYNVPKHILGLTGYQDALDAALPHFEKDVLQLIHYDAGSNDWSEKLLRVARRIVQSQRMPSDFLNYHAHLGIVTALRSPELEAVLALPWEWAAWEIPADPTVYYKGRYLSGGHTCEVVAAAAPRMGMTASAVLATKMIMTFRPRYLATVGILAGIQGEVQLGDILVADPGWDYGSGKQTIKKGKSVFAAAPHQMALDPFLRAKLMRMAQDNVVLDEIRRGWQGGTKQSVVSMKLGPVASGAAVLEDPAVTNAIKLQHRKTLGVEMETYGILVAADECPSPQPKAFSLKSVCDFADPRKNNDWQSYAAYTSASALRYFVERYL